MAQTPKSPKYTVPSDVFCDAHKLNVLGLVVKELNHEIEEEEIEEDWLDPVECVAELCSCFLDCENLSPLSSPRIYRRTERGGDEEIVAYQSIRFWN